MALYSKGYLVNALVSVIRGCCGMPRNSWLGENNGIPELNRNNGKIQKLCSFISHVSQKKSCISPDYICIFTRGGDKSFTA